MRIFHGDVGIQPHMNTSRFSSCELHNSRPSDRHKDGRAANSRAQATPKRARNAAYTVHQPSNFCLRTTFPPTLLLETSSSATFILQTPLLHHRSKVLSTDHQRTNAFSRNCFLLNVLSANSSFASLFWDHLPTNVSSRNNSPPLLFLPNLVRPNGAVQVRAAKSSAQTKPKRARASCCERHGAAERARKAKASAASQARVTASDICKHIYVYTCVY